MLSANNLKFGYNFIFCGAEVNCTTSVYLISFLIVCILIHKGIFVSGIPFMNCFSFSFCGTRVRTQGFLLAKQALYLLEYKIDLQSILLWLL
jgi:hypothetical protein